MRTLLVAIVLLSGLCANAKAQFKAAEETRGTRLGKPVTQRLKIGVIVTATGGSCQNLIATATVPGDWPEQTVRVANEELSPPVRNLRYRTSAGHLKQMVIDIPQLPEGQEARALITFDVDHAPQLAPESTSDFKIPKKVDRQLTVYTGNSPSIEMRHPKIAALAKELTADKASAWEQVEAIYNWVSDNIKVKDGDLKGAARALHDKTGDTEDLASLFIALCRAAKIPARTVWVPQHCYPEFYLVDGDGEGFWFPCQVGGIKQFGKIDEIRPIMLKGDSFKDPERPREKFRFVPEFIKGSGTGKPKVQFVREILP